MEKRMKTETNIIQVTSKSRPEITIDPLTKAVYIKFSNKDVSKTIDDSANGVIVNIDVDGNGDVVGVELIGVKNFTLMGTQKMLSQRINRIPDLMSARINTPPQRIPA